MNHDQLLIDILLIDDNESVIDIFKILTKKFNLTIKYAKNTQEFIELSKKYNFSIILCDLNLDYKFEGFFIARLFSSLKLMRHLDSKVLLFSSQTLTNDELLKFSFDGSLDKNFHSIYNFLEVNFPFRSYTEEITLEEQVKAYYVSYY